jgi:hypothetical protein
VFIESYDYLLVKIKRINQPLYFIYFIGKLNFKNIIIFERQTSFIFQTMFYSCNWTTIMSKWYSFWFKLIFILLTEKLYSHQKYI